MLCLSLRCQALDAGPNSPLVPGLTSLDAERLRASSGKRAGVDLGVRERVAEGWHLGAAAHDDCRDAVVIGWHSAGQVLFFVNIVQAGAVQAMAGIGLVAAGAIGIKDMAADGLGGSESKFGIGLPGFGVAAGQGKQREQRRAGEGGRESALPAAALGGGG